MKGYWRRRLEARIRAGLRHHNLIPNPSMESYRAAARERYLREKERREKESIDKSDTKANRDNAARPGKVEGEDMEGKGEVLDVEKKSGFEAGKLQMGYVFVNSLRLNAYSCVRFCVDRMWVYIRVSMRACFVCVCLCACVKVVCQCNDVCD